jgi:hypothetical protein
VERLGTRNFLSAACYLDESSTLVIEGTENDDHVSVGLSDTGDMIIVDCDGEVSEFGVDEVADVYFRGRWGDDSFVNETDLDCVIRGGLGDDTLVGGDGDDLCRGGQGSDDLFGNLGDDTVRGGAGEDEVHGGDGNDLCRGGLGDDLIYGEDGIDDLYGGFGDDTCEGGVGDDSLHGEAGFDDVSGGEGSDVIDVSECPELVLFRTELDGEGHGSAYFNIISTEEGQQLQIGIYAYVDVVGSYEVYVDDQLVGTLDIEECGGGELELCVPADSIEVHDGSVLHIGDVLEGIVHA